MADEEKVMGGITDKLGLTGSDSITDKFFGDNIPNELKNPRLTSFTSPGLNAAFKSPEQLELERSQGTTDALSGISGAFKTQAGELGALKPLVEPGFGRLTQAGINAVRDARRASMGDLRQNLARRRVLGSSFGADDISRTNAEFAKKENEFASQAFTQELALSNELINQKAIASANEFLTSLKQVNIESNMATQLASGVTSVLSNNANAMAGMTNSGSSSLMSAVGAGIGAYAAMCSRDFKVNKRPVASILPRISMLPVEAWEYDERFDDNQTHIGPYAEDFKELFGVGDGRVINYMDAIGVLFLGMKELIGERNAR